MLWNSWHTPDTGLNTIQETSTKDSLHERSFPYPLSCDVGCVWLEANVVFAFMLGSMELSCVTDLDTFAEKLMQVVPTCCRSETCWALLCRSIVPKLPSASSASISEPDKVLSEDAPDIFTSWSASNRWFPAEQRQLGRLHRAYC